MRRIIGLWIGMLMVVQVTAQSKAEFSYESFVQGNDTLPYRLLKPVDYNPARSYPLIVFLHGSGSRGSDNETVVAKMPAIFASDSFRKAYPCFFAVPQCSKNDVWVDFTKFPNSLRATDSPTIAGRLVLALAKSMSKQKDIDKRRIYLTGYSMGGEGTIDLMTRNLKLFAAGIAIAPVADTSHAVLLKDKPIWILHGDKDAVNGVQYSRMMVEALTKQCGDIHYTEYEGEGHGIAKKAYEEPELFMWLFSQRSN